MPIIKCKECGKCFSVAKYREHTANFCSQKCSSLWRSKNITGNKLYNWKGGDVNLVCEICGKVFKRRRWYVNKYKHKCCSHACMAKSTTINRSGENSPQWRGKHIKFNCVICNKEFELMPSELRQGRGKYCSNKCHGLAKSTQIREKSHNWQGGLTSVNKFARRVNKYKIWRAEIFKRDNYTCQKCGKTKTYFHAHHIKPLHRLIKKSFKTYPLLTQYDAIIAYPPIWNTSNGITLCEPCHNKINKRRK